MITMNGKDGIEFDWLNIINFWLVEFALVKTEETPKEKYIGWIKDDSDDYLYKHLYTVAFTIILKYNMLSMGIPQGEVYEITVSTLLCYVLTFDLYEGIEQSVKLVLFC